jgi:response regulator RpfG family c-di-GMP phosphodiesterase
MKTTTLCLFLAVALSACSDNQQEKIDTFNEKNAKRATEYIKKPLDQAREVQKMAEEKYRDMEKNQGE